jgi:hypothetical protein
VVWIVQQIELVELRVKGVKGPELRLITNYIFFFKIYLDIKVNCTSEYN